MKEDLKTYILTLLIVLLSAILSYSKEITVKKLLIPKINGITYKDTLLNIVVLNSTSISINGIIKYNLIKKVSFSKEYYMVYESYKSKDNKFKLCFEIHPDTSKIIQVILFSNNKYYCLQ
jgi:hypothetical protein